MEKMLPNVHISPPARSLPPSPGRKTIPFFISLLSHSHKIPALDGITGIYCRLHEPHKTLHGHTIAAAYQLLRISTAQPRSRDQDNRSIRRQSSTGKFHRKPVEDRFKPVADSRYR